MVIEDTVPFASVVCGAAVGNGARDIMRHRGRDERILFAVPEKNRNGDIFQAKASGTDQQIHVAIESIRSVAIGFDGCFDH